MATTSNSHNPSTNDNGNGNAGNGRVELRNIPLSQIVVTDGFNPRGEIVEDAGIEAMAQTMRDRGCLQSIRVRATETGEYVLVAGERRYRAAALAALTEIPATVLSAGAGDEAEQLDLLCDAMIENEVRSDLDPLQRAQGYQAMIDAGLSVRGVAERLGGKAKRGSREKRIKEHLAILTLPEKLRALVASEKVPLLAVKALGELCEIHDELAHNAVAAVLDAGEHSEPSTWADVAREPLAIAVDSSSSLPAGLFRSHNGYPLQTFSLGEKAKKDLTAYQTLTGGEIAEVRFTFDLVNQGRVLGAVHDFGWGSLIAGQDVGDRLAEDYISQTLKQARAQRRSEREADKARHAAGGTAGPVVQSAPRGTPENAKAQQRQADQQQREHAIRFNEALGLLTFKHLVKLKVDERVLRILASVDIGGALSGIAARGARLALPGWVTQTQQRNGKTKTVYLEPHDVTRKAEEFLSGGQSAGDIAGRALTLIALASLADENAIARSRRSFYMLSFRGPWAAQAKRDLHAIVRERIKEGQLPALDELLAERIAMDEENARLEAEIEQALARLDGVSDRLDQLTDAELDQAIGDAELAWDTYSAKTHRLRADIEAVRLRRTGGDTGEEHAGQPEEELVAVAA